MAADALKEQNILRGNLPKLAKKLATSNIFRSKEKNCCQKSYLKIQNLSKKKTTSHTNMLPVFEKKSNHELSMLENI